MPRRRPETRFDDLVETAANVFARHGFRRTQMADIARELGVSAGTLYGYVESKEALFDLTVQRAFTDEIGHEARGDGGPGQSGAPVPTLPVPTPERDEVIAHVRARLASARSPALSAALRRQSPPDDDAVAELEQILREIYGFVHANRRGFALIERAANDRPELAALYYERGRVGLLERLERYLRARVDGGFLEPVPDLPAAARMLIESIAWFARHRHGDFDGALHDEEAARETVVAMLVRSLERRKR